jgi:hypothetical protein
MDVATKAKLAAYNKAKRAKVVLLKDVSPDALQVACDAVEEQDRVPSLGGYHDVPGYLKYASPAQVAALKARIPSQPGRVAAGPRGGRDVVCFNFHFVRRVLKFLGVNPDRYVAVCPSGHGSRRMP